MGDRPDLDGPDGAEEEPVADASDLREQATDAAIERGGDLVEPPAQSEDETPVCFGDFDTEERPCDSCEVRKDCQFEYLGM